MSRDSWRAAYTVQCSRGQRSLRCREETFLPREANPPVAIEGLPLAFCLQLDAVEHNKYAVLQLPLEEEARPEEEGKDERFRFKEGNQERSRAGEEQLDGYRKTTAKKTQGSQGE